MINKTNCKKITKQQTIGKFKMPLKIPSPIAVMS